MAVDLGPLGWLPPYDDAYITLTSAQAVWSGAIPAYPGTPTLAGVTSPAHMLLVAVLLRVAAPLTALWLSQVIGAALYASGLYALGRSWQLDRRTSAALLVMGVFVGLVPHQLFNGLETGLVLGVVTWALALASRESRVAPAAFAVLPVVRPELGILSVALFAWTLWRQPPARWREIVIVGAAAAAPWLAWLTWQTGGVLPNTAGVKRSFIADGCWPLGQRAAYLASALARWGAALGLVAGGAAGLALVRGLPRVCALALLAALGGYAVGLPSHLPAYHHQRYLYGWLPVVILGAAALVQRYARMRQAIPLVLLTLIVRAPANYREHRASTAALLREEMDLTRWLAAHAPLSDPLMVIDAGYLAFATQYHLVDAVGLKSPSSAALHRAITGPSCGARRGEALAKIAADGGVRLFVDWGEWEQWFALTEQIEAGGRWRVELVRARPAAVHDDAWYPVYSLTPVAERVQAIHASSTARK